jgi:TonB-dependent SusC/RagA subfamily outer membrane receptor
MTVRRIALALTLAVLAAPHVLEAQITGTIEGVVRSEHTGRPIANATVQLLGTSIASTTDRQGRYRMEEVPRGDHLIRVTHSDHVTTTERAFVPTTGTHRVDLSMSAPQYVLDEVRAVVDREVERRAVLTEDELRGATSGTIQEALDQVSGVQLVRTGGEVGRGWYLRVRGARSFSFNRPPVVVLDGIRVSTLDPTGGLGILELIGPEDVARVEILRGAAAAARFGPEAANGVILVTTKRGGGGP